MLYYVLVEFHKDFVNVIGNQITIGVKTKPVGCAANKEIIKKISKHFGAPHLAIKIVF